MTPSTPPSSPSASTQALGRVLVTGGTGFIGSHLVRRLVREAAAVHLFARPQTSTERLSDCLPHVTLHTVDVRDAVAVGRAVRLIKPSVVFHLATYGVDPQETDPSLMTAVNVLGTLHVLRACHANGPPRVVHAGSCFEYLIDPSHGGHEEFAYAASKLAATGLCQTFHRQAGIPCVILRPFTVYGPDEHPGRLVPSVLRAIQRGEAPHVTSGEQRRDFVFVGDVVEGFLRAARCPVAAGRIMDVGTGQAISVRDVVHALLRVTGSPLEPRFGALAQRPSDQYPLVADPEPAHQCFGWRATTSLADGLRATWEWYQAHEERPRTMVGMDVATPRAGDAHQLKAAIFEKVRTYYEAIHQPKPFVPFESKVPYAGRVFDAHELTNLIDSALDFWLTLGPYGDQLEQRLQAFFGAKDAVLVNSGSSANLLAVSTLRSPKLARRLEPGDEVITPAVTFPTSLAPLVQAGLVPVFLDCEPGTYNLNLDHLEAAISPRTKAVLLPHTLGNCCDLERLGNVIQRHRLWLIEDCCDALGGTFSGKLLGTFGDLATLSFYPAHHVTMGEGGAVIVNRPELVKIARSIRDWGRDCWCAPGVSNTCGRRFQWQLGDLPYGYDHKYIYSHLGYNLKPTDLQAAIGVAQLEKLPEFIEKRRRNFSRLSAALQPYEEALLLPRHDPRADPSWFGFPVTVRGGLARSTLVDWLEAARIETRQIFAGNILHQPAYQGIRHRVVGGLEESDRIMRDAFFIGVYPGLSDAMLEFVIDRFRGFFASARQAVSQPVAAR